MLLMWTSLYFNSSYCEVIDQVGQVVDFKTTVGWILLKNLSQSPPFDLSV
jgi:hypothetical protein